tara:strand:+ start:240 stop:434 length:195 start_codon:yes stop_codon:yes gene_type:complete
MNKIIKYVKEWCRDYNAVQKELNDMGLWIAYCQWGAYVHYVEPKFSTHINTTDDKFRTIPNKNK